MNSLDLNKLEQKLDESLSNETTETLTKFLNDKRMSNNKQSSIDILCGKLAMKLGIPQAITFYIDHQEEIAEAKAMHRHEIRTAYCHGEFYQEEKLTDQYYNETFGGNNEQQ